MSSVKKTASPERIDRPEDGTIDRPALARRWRCHTETLRRKEKTGQLHPLQLGERMIRYRLQEIVEIEREAASTQTAKAKEKGVRPRRGRATIEPR